MNFIKRVMNDKSKRLVLTSRSNILNRAKRISDIFNFGNIEQRELEINVTELTEIEKANILYNHIWHSSLSPEFSTVFYENRNYWSIIKHKNYNPRLISIITDRERLKGMPHTEYWSHVQNSLNNPEVIWDSYFKRQIPEEIFDLVNLVVFNGGQIEEDTCRDALKRVFQLKYPNEYFTKVKKIDDFIKESLRSTLNRNIQLEFRHRKVTFSPFNPSISDYIINRLSNDDTTLSLYFGALKTTDSINTLFSLLDNRKLYSSVFNSVLVYLIENASINGLDDYAIKLYNKIIKSNLEEYQKIQVFPFSSLTGINNNIHSYNYRIGECILWCVEKRKDLFNINFISNYIEYAFSSENFHTLYHEDYLPLAKLELFFPEIKFNHTYGKLKDIVIESLRDGFDGMLGDSSTILRLSPDEFDRANDVAFDFLNDILNEYPFEFSDNEAEYIFEGVDVSQHLPDYSYSGEFDDDRYRPQSFNHVDSAAYINDLFSRD